MKVFGGDTHGGLFSLAGSLPETDIVEQLVHMVVESLLALLGSTFAQ